MSMASQFSGGSGMNALNQALMQGTSGYAGPGTAAYGAGVMQQQQSALAQGQQAGQYGLKNTALQGQYGNQQAQIGAQAQEYGAQQGAQAQEQSAVSSAAPALLSAQNQQGRFNTVLPYFQSLAGQAGIGGGGSGGASGGGAVGNYGYGQAGAPSVSAPPTGVPAGLGISPQQLQANINVNNAQNWGQAGGQSKQATQQLAGSGLGATSPLAKALQANYFGQALAANTAGATNAQNQAAQTNISAAGVGAQEYGSQVGAQASEYGSALDYQAALAQVQAQKQNAILAALASFSG